MASVYQTLLNIEREGDLNPSQKTQLETLKRQQGAGVPGQRSPAEIAREMWQVGEEFRKPAIETLEAGRGRIAPAYEELRGAAEAEREPLTQRYQDLLKDITSTTRQAAGAEVTRRGLPISSGITEQMVGSRLAGPIATLGREREAGLRGLTQLQAGYGQQELGAQTELDRAIATIQAAGAPEAVTSALSIYQQQQQSQQQQSQLALQRWQTEQQTAQQAAQLGFQQEQASWQQPWSEKLWQYQLDEPYYKPTQTLGEGITPFPD